METLERIDEEILLWLNGWVGRFSWLDAIAEVVISDYLAPALLALTLLGLWFAGRTEGVRARNQRAVLTAVVGLALSGMVVDWLLNQLVFRARPFLDHDLALLFYEPTDSSFPANPAVVAFAVATGVWLWNRRAGAVLYAVAVLYSLSRLYGGVFYPSDILSGAAIGAGASLLAYWGMRRFEAVPTRVIQLARAIYLG